MSAPVGAPPIEAAEATAESVVSPERLDRSSVAAFDAFLGDPSEPGAVISTDRSIELDEASAFPRAEISAVDAWGLQRAYVPEEHGGCLGDVFVPMTMIRRLAGRDVTAAVAHGKTFLGAVGAWIAGGPIAAEMAAIVVTGDPVSWGLTEQGRGSDLSNTATVAALGADIRVSGVKWPINNATRGRAMTVLARTSDQPGPRSLSLVLVDKQRVDAGSLSYRPKVATHGIRGADISGLEFRSAVVEGDHLVGAPGHGLEIVLKSLQLTRPLTTALSLGAADHAIAIATGFASNRRLFGRTLADLPTARATLGTAIADSLLAESVMYAGARGAHRTTEEMSLVSALVKFLVPDTVDLMFRDLTPFVGARSQLLGIAGVGAFQKAARDNRVVGIFDGNSVVNLNMVINEFPSIAREADAVAAEAVVADFGFGEADGWVDTTRLRLVTKRGSRLLRSLPALVDLLGERPAAASARRIALELDRLVAAAGLAPRESAPSAESFDLAERIALCFGAACAIATELASPQHASAPSEVRLTAILDRLAVRLGLAPSTAAAASAAALAELALEEAGRSRSVTMLDGWADAA
ncbi:acyl-CoA dehydrogenase family protein [Agromyces allii]|uniref:Acyl-CoA dehydrogenase n=1 Tax=Agromyces allii TaxID=393607 RepID=A0ABN2R2E1_9MICO|nr:acyl-CoA dehydrogenase [Agromyces allii]